MQKMMGMRGRECKGTDYRVCYGEVKRNEGIRKVRGMCEGNEREVREVRGN